jgi:hypothetical protein
MCTSSIRVVRSVLLNRPGRNGDTLAGYDDNQVLDVTFEDGAPDVHVYRSVSTEPLTGPLTGTFGPDGRPTDPALALDSDARALFLDGFRDQDASGEWTLFVADLSGGGVHRLESWALRLDVTVIPEPRIWVGATALAVWGAIRTVRGRERRDRG